jgi:hypothetical protein
MSILRAPDAVEYYWLDEFCSDKPKVWDDCQEVRFSKEQQSILFGKLPVLEVTDCDPVDYLPKEADGLPQRFMINLKGRTFYVNTGVPHLVFLVTEALKIDVKKQITFWSFPNILIINFKRFNSKNKKNNILITFPIDNLDLSNYVIGYKKNSYNYELYGICNHNGNSNGGHYTSYIKNENQKWYHFNDHKVEEVKDNSQIISPNAYCLFYRKKI